MVIYPKPHPIYLRGTKHRYDMCLTTLAEHSGSPAWKQELKSIFTTIFMDMGFSKGLREEIYQELILNYPKSLYVHLNSSERDAVDASFWIRFLLNII